MESERNPSGATAEGARSPRASADVRPRGPSPYPNNNPSTTTTPAAGPVVVDLVRSLTDRGIEQASATRLVAEHDDGRVQSAIACFDEQGDLSPGGLVQAIRQGWKPRPTRASNRVTVESQIKYGEQIVAWLRQQFGDNERICDPDYPEPHPAAIAAVIRLHYIHGKGQITRAEHGPLILAAVERFDERFMEPTPATGATP